MKKALSWPKLLTIYALYTIGTAIGTTNIFRSICKKRAAFQLIGKSARLDAAVIATEVAHTSIVCSLKCTHDSLCKSINFNVKTKKCEKLFGSRAIVGASKLVASSSWEYYEPDDIQVIVIEYILFQLP